MSNRILFLLVFCGIGASALGQSSFPRFNFTAGGGLGIGRGEVASFVGNSSQAVVGGGMNLSRLFGFDAEYMYYGLGFKSSVAHGPANLNDASGHLQAISLDGIVNVPYHAGKLGAYGIFGIGFYRRSVSTTSQPLLPLSICQPVWMRWWDVNCVGNPPRIPPPPAPAQTLSSNSKDAGGFNIGGGVTYRLNHLGRSKVFVEWRYHRAYHSDGLTIVMPVTVGLRW